MRAEVLLPAVKRRLVEVGYYAGPIGAHWDDAAERAWLMYCERFGFKYTPLPDTHRQEAAQRDVMLQWYAAEEAAQIAQGIMPPEPIPPPTLYDIIKMYSEEPPLPGVDDEIIDAKRERGLVGDAPPTESTEQLEEERRSLEEERRKSVRAALKAAKRVVKEHMPDELRQFAAEPPPAKPKTERLTKRKAKIKATESTPERQTPLLRVRG